MYGRLDKVAHLTNVVREQRLQGAYPSHLAYRLAMDATHQVLRLFHSQSSRRLETHTQRWSLVALHRNQAARGIHR